MWLTADSAANHHISNGLFRSFLRAQSAGLISMSGERASQSHSSGNYSARPRPAVLKSSAFGQQQVRARVLTCGLGRHARTRNCIPLIINDSLALSCGRHFFAWQLNLTSLSVPAGGLMAEASLLLLHLTASSGSNENERERPICRQDRKSELLSLCTSVNNYQAQGADQEKEARSSIRTFCNCFH